MLWKFDFMVEGKHLERVLEALAGVALELRGPLPVSNGMVKQGKVKQKVAGTNNTARIVNKLTDMGMLVPGSFVTSSAIQLAMDELAIPKTNYSGVMTNLQSQSVLTKTDRRGMFKAL